MESRATFIGSLSYYGLTPEVLAVLLSAMVAGWYAHRTIKHNQSIERLRLTFETVQRTLWDIDFVNSRKAFNKLRDSNGGLVRFATLLPEDADHIAHVRQILNDYENMCIGMKLGIIDEQYMYQWKRQGFIEDWESSKGFVTHIRTLLNRPKAFEYFEEIAESWKKGQSVTKNGTPFTENLRIIKFEKI